MVVDTLGRHSQRLLDYGLIFGHFGLPRLGIEGAAWATVTSLWFRVVVYGGLDDAAAVSPAVSLVERPAIERPACCDGYGVIGAPNGLQLLVEVAGFTLFLLLVGNLGKTAMAATTLAFNVNTLAFVPMFGLGIALSTIVGQQLGRNNAGLAARATWTALWMAMVYMARGPWSTCCCPTCC